MPPPPSLARSLFDHIMNDPLKVIPGFVNSDPPTTESDHFDTKLEDRDQKQRDKKAAEIWSKCLGGFANAGGGVLVWGLDARKPTVGQKVDSVIGEAPVSNPRELASRLRELQRQATDPPLGGVEIQTVPLTGDDTKGFIVCFIPDGPHKPYRSEQAGQQFYMRAGDNTVVMPKAVLASQFYPRSKAVFRVKVGLTQGRAEYQPGGAILKTKAVAAIALMNVGTATAKDILVRITFEMPGLKLEAASHLGELWDNAGGQYAIRRSDSFQPGIENKVMEVRWEVPDEIRNLAHLGHGPDCHFQLVVYAENYEPQTIRLPINLQELFWNDKLTVVETAAE